MIRKIQINVNDDVIGFLNRMDNAMEGIYGSLYYYDPLDLPCKQIMDLVSGVYSLPLALQESGVSRSVSEGVVMDIATIATVDELGNAKLHQRIDIPLEMTNTGKTIYLKCLDDCGFNMNSVKNYLTNFYSLLGYHSFKVPLIPEAPAGPYILDSVQLIPDIQISTQRLTKEIVKEGAVVLFGDVSKIIDKAVYQYLEFLPVNYQNRAIRNSLSSLEHYLTFTRYWPNPQLAETASGKFFAMVKNDYIDDFIDPFRSSSRDHLAAFLTLHANGHNADIKHDYTFYREEWSSSSGLQKVAYYSDKLGYMSDGCVILRHYFDTKPPTGGCSYPKGENIFENLNELVYHTNNIYPIEVREHIKLKLYERFIKN